jgi:hypothetical protein
MAHHDRPSSRKQRLTFSLSQRAVRFLKSYSAKSKARSVSAALESILAERELQKKRDDLEANMTAYYDSLSPEEQEADRVWGEFSELQMTDTET